MMLSKYEARLCPVYRSIDDCLEAIGDLGYLEGYPTGSQNGFDPETARRVLDSVQATTSLLNRLTAVYRDVAGISDHVTRIKFDLETGAPELSNSWNEASLRDEVIWFLATEAAATKQMLYGPGLTLR